METHTQPYHDAAVIVRYPDPRHTVEHELDSLALVGPQHGTQHRVHHHRNLHAILVHLHEHNIYW